MKRTRLSPACIAILTAFAGAAAAAPVDSGFTYQGELAQSGSPVNGVADFRFRLYDAASQGHQVGVELQALNVTLVEGRFAADLDFGAASFAGEDRWLEIDVRSPAGVGAFTPLSTRQRVAPAPYSLFAAGAADSRTLNGQLAAFYQDAGNLASGTIPDTRLGASVARTDVNQHFTGQMNFSSQGNIFAGTFNGTHAGDGSALTGLNASNIGSGVLSDSRLSTNVARLSVANIFTGNNYFQGTVGINTFNPTERLDVRGNVRVQDSLLLDAADQPLVVRQWNAFTSGPKQGLGRWGLYMEPATLFMGVAGTDYGPTSRLGFGGWRADGTREDWMTVLKGGNVGIGTSSPAHRFEVFSAGDGNSARISSSASFTLLSLSNTSAGGTGWGLISTGASWPTGAGELVIRNIGTGADLMTFEPTNNRVGFYTANPQNPAGYSSIVHIAGSGNGSAGVVYSHPAQGTWTAGINNAGKFAFDKNGGGSNVVSVPVLEIRGGSDLAEPFEVNAAQAVEPGMVVCIDPQNPGEMRLATSAYDTTVAGVISGANGINAGMILRQEGTIADGSHPVALTGRVYCWVDADAGEIRPGDLLTTSDTPGHAMKVGDHARATGAIIGKAMTGLDRGRGMVLVLVNLH